MNVRRIGGQKLKVLRSNLTDRDFDIAYSVYRCRFLSTGHIERLHFTGYDSLETRSRVCRRALQRLERKKVLRRSERRVGGFGAGSAAFIYELGPIGVRLLADKPPYYYSEEASHYFLNHTLGISELYVQLHEWAQTKPEFNLEIQTEPRCWRYFMTMSGQLEVLKPDIYTQITIDNEELYWFVEIDQATTHVPALRKKANLYEQYYLTGIEQQNGVFPRVLWVTPTSSRSNKLKDALQPFNAHVPDLFWCTISNRASSILTHA